MTHSDSVTLVSWIDPLLRQPILSNSPRYTCLLPAAIPPVQFPRLHHLSVFLCKASVQVSNYGEKRGDTLLVHALEYESQSLRLGCQLRLELSSSLGSGKAALLCC